MLLGSQVDQSHWQYLFSLPQLGENLNWQAHLFWKECIENKRGESRDSLMV
jgi:hypothetical protein